MKEQILKGLESINPSIDSHWTQDGLVNLVALKMVSGLNVTREQVEEAAPGFKRDNAVLPKQQDSVDNVDTSNSPTVTDAPTGNQKLTVNVGIKFDETLRTLMGLNDNLPSVNELSDEELNALFATVNTKRGELINLRVAVSNFIEANLRHLVEIESEHSRRNPPEPLAKQIKNFHESVSGKQFACDAPRPRMVRPHPLLK